MRLTAVFIIQGIAGTCFYDYSRGFHKNTQAGRAFGRCCSHRCGEFSKEMSQWLSTGQIKYREHIVDGLENAPEAFIGMLVGQNFGKLVVRLNDAN